MNILQSFRNCQKNKFTKLNLKAHFFFWHIKNFVAKVNCPRNMAGRRRVIALDEHLPRER